MTDNNKQLPLGAVPRFVYKEYAVQVRPGGVFFPGGVIFTGASIVGHLKGCAYAVVLAATLGHGADTTLRRLQHVDMAAAVSADADANALVEQVCDEAEKEIGESAARRGFAVTTRFSPGYGDFSLAHQPAMLKLSGAGRELGIALSENNLMLPQKSISAIIGLRQVAVPSAQGGL